MATTGVSNELPALATDEKAVLPNPSIYEASTVAEIRATLASLHVRDTHVTSQLQTLLASQAELSRELGRLDLLRAHLGTQVVNTRSISNGMLDQAATTAHTLSAKVKSLDLEKTRVEETLGVVEQVADLKACVQGVVGSMGAPQDWEAAAGYIARAGRIPEKVVSGQFAASIVPSVEVPDAPGVTLRNAKESLCGLFLREFEKAATDGDGARITRFFKLFPLIGRSNEGLDVYGKYVCQGVAAAARKNLKPGIGGEGRHEGFFYANALTKLFEHIAQIVEGHGALVERHYGKGKMVKVIERLQMEADVQGGIILDTWSDERNIDRRLTDVKSYPFSFLVQSFLPSQKGSMGLNTPRTNSPAGGDTINGRMSEDEGVDMKEIDGFLSEIAVMLGRWALFSRFISGKIKDPDTPDDAHISMPDLLTKSTLQRKISARLMTPFNIMTTFFFRRSVEKAFQLDESPTGLSLNPNKALDGNPPYIISALDVIMYIVSTIIQRSISAAQRDIIAAVIPTIGRVLGSDFVGMVQRKMRDESYPKPMVQGGFPPEDKIIAFIVLINSLDVSNDYISRIINTQLGSSQVNGQPNGTTKHPSPLADAFPFAHDSTFVGNALATLNTSFAAKTSELISDGIQVLFSQVIKTRLRPVLSDTFRDVDYSLSEADLEDIARANDMDFHDSEVTEAVSRRFEDGWSMLMVPIKRLMTERTYVMLLEQTTKYLASFLEKRVWHFAGRTNALGAVRMERDVMGIVGVVCRGGAYALRDVFTRVAQILMVSNMEEEEWDEIRSMESRNEETVKWIISVEERARARNIVRS